MFTHTEDRETVYAWFTFSHWLVYANSAANPIIYNFLSGEFSTVPCMEATILTKGEGVNDQKALNSLEMCEELNCYTMRCFSPGSNLS